MSKNAVILIAIVLLECIFWKAYADIPIAERDALNHLYDSTGGYNWKERTNWLDGPGTECLFWA